MPDLTLDEADRCPYCGAILRYPIKCCKVMRDEEILRQKLEESEQHDIEYDEHWFDEALEGQGGGA